MIPTASPEIDKDWRIIVTQRLKQRNNFEYQPFVEIYEMNEMLFEENLQINVSLNDAKTKISAILSEVSNHNNNLVNPGTAMSEAQASLFERIKNNLGLIHNEYKEPQEFRKVFNQRKLLFHQSEELATLKSELSTSLELTSQLSKKLVTEQSAHKALLERLETLIDVVKEHEGKILALEHENKTLVQKIVTDKKETADKLNEMNEMIDSKCCSCVRTDC